MTDGIYYNQEVTAEDINAIARDLGNTSFNGFGEEKFGAPELNGITASLVTAGVLITNDNCSPSYSSESLTIASGTIVFANGAKKTIDEAVSVTADAGNWIYALNNVAAGTCSIVVSETEPTEATGDYVPIAQISSDGTLIDRRIFSSAKVNMPTGNQRASGRAVTDSMTNETTHNMGFEGFNYIIYARGSDLQAIDISDGEAHTIPIANQYNSPGYATVQKIGSKLVFKKTTSSNIALSFTVI